MYKSYKTILLALALGCTALTPLMARAEPVAPVNFPHEVSARKPDPAARYGRLPNGMTYILQKGANPPGTAQIYLRIAAGSMMETAEQRGLAHFIEHMAFNGTTHIPEGELKPILERHGFAFGADANAFTSESNTVYTLFAPKTDADTLDTALFILREVAGNMTLAPEAIDRERGVILGEERLRDGPLTHRNDKWNHQVYAGTRFADYSNAIGLTDIIRTAPPAQFRAFYDAWYRPDQATLILVGDVDVDAMEARIKAKFSDWSGRGPAPQVPDWGTRAPAPEQTFAYAEKGITEEMGVTWLSPLDTRPDSDERSIDRALDGFLGMLINRRFQLAAQAPDAAFLAASVGTYDVYKTTHSAYLSVTPKPGRAKEAFEQAYGILQTARAGGVTEAETAQIRMVLPVILRNLQASWPTRANGDIAGQLLSGFGDNTVAVDLETGVATLNAATPKITSKAALDARLATWFTGDGPILSHSGETLGDFDEAAMRASYDALNQKTAGAYASAAVKPWPYTDFGPAVKPSTHKADKDFGYTRYTWPNGVTLDIKPTKLALDQVMVSVDFAGGQLSFDPAHTVPFVLAPGSILVEGGLNRLTWQELGDTLVDRSIGVYYSLGGRKATLSGNTVKADVGVQLEALMAYATDSAYRPEPFERWRAYVPEALRTLKASPDAVRNYYWGHLLNSGDPRFDQTQLEGIGAVDYDRVRALYRASLDHTPIAITVVGDVDEAAVVAQVSRTFGTLAKRPDKAVVFPGADVIAFPPPEHDFTLYHQGRADQSVSVAVWPTDDYWANPRASRGLSLLAGVMTNRLYDRLREKEGADYAPQAFASDNEDYRHNGLVGVISNVKAGGDDEVRAAVADIVADLKAHPVSADELNRVRQPVLSSMDNEVKNNGYWQFVIARVAGDPRARADWLKRRSDIEGVTPDELMALANRYLRDDTAIHIKVVPEVAAKP